jgi:hypothetical protein
MAILKHGSKGREVNQWQEWLTSRNLPVDIDGDFGPATLKATKEWQRRAKIDADGQVGPKTLAKAVELGFKGFDGKAEKVVTKPIDKPSDAVVSIFKGGSEIDKKNQAMIVKLHPKLQDKAVKFLGTAKKDGWTLQIVQGLRTFAEQQRLYEQGRTRPGKKVTNAPAGKSNHNYGTAFDAAPIVEGSISWNEKHFQLFGKWAKSAGLSWGGNWKKFVDLPHLELPNTPSVSTMLGWYRKGGLAEVWKNVGG